MTYNSGRFIKRCLESVLAQKYPPKEIIVIDNTSTDGTVDILEQFEDRCRIVYNRRTSASPPRRTRPSQLSNGDWILTLNPDVLLLPNFIQALVDAGQIDPQDRHGLRQAADDQVDLRSSGASRWSIPPASTSRRCCGTWIAAARKSTTGTT